MKQHDMILLCVVYFSSYFCLFVLSLLVCRSCQVGWLQWWGKTQYITLIYPHLSSIVLIVFIWLYIHSFHRKRFLLDVEVGVGHLLVFNSCRRDAWCVECSQIRAECSPVNGHFYWDHGQMINLWDVTNTRLLTRLSCLSVEWIVSLQAQ